MDGAQQALSTLQQDSPAATNGASPQSGSNGSPLDALVKAVQSGDEAGAQQALANLQKQHGHHHHYGSQSGQGNASIPTGSVVNVTA